MRTAGRAGILATAVAALCTLAAHRAQGAEIYYYPTAWYTPTVWADSTYYPTSWYVPTTYTTSAYWPTSYVVPTSYYVPTVYTPTAYYSQTAYYRTGLFGRIRQRPVYTTTRYVYDLTPTVYTSYVPTAWTVPLSATSYVSDPCEVGTVGSSVAPTNATSGGSRSGQNDGGNSAQPPKTVQSQPQNGSNSATPPGNNSGNNNGLDEPGLDRPVPDDAGTRGNMGLNNTGDSSVRRSAMRPAATVMTPQNSTIAPNALHGEVMNSVDGKPRGNARIVFTDARQTYRDRERTTDAQGRFEVVLPNGDWTVNVEDASGKLVPYGTITSAGGRFYDDTDRVVSLLRLNQ
jgi:hypothetical protein